MSHALADCRHSPILLVDTRFPVLRRMGDLLRRSGYDVIEAGSFEEGNRLLAERRPPLLISNLRLAAFNGLHLVHLGRLTQPDLTAIIISAGADVALQAEAERAGASLLVEPVPNSTLLSLIVRVLEPESDRNPIASGFTSGRGVPHVERRRADRRRLVMSDFAPERRAHERRAMTGTELEPSLA
jgi:two-component system NtrC family sensor kinase